MYFIGQNGKNGIKFEKKFKDEKENDRIKWMGV